MKPRLKSKTSLKFVLITRQSNFFTHLLPPEEFRNNAIDFIKKCPEDLLQLHDSIGHLENKLVHNLQIGHDFHVIYKKDINNISRYLGQESLLKVLLVDTNINQHLKNGKLFPDDKDLLTYFYLLGSDKKIQSPYNQVTNPFELIYSLIQNQSEILKALKIEDGNINPSVYHKHKEINSFKYFKPTINNFHLLNRTLGNFGIESEDENEQEIENATNKAHQNRNGWDRQNQFIDQIENIDFFRLASYKHKILKPASSIEPILSPLVISLPFHNPDIKKIYGENEITYSLQSEQTSNYINIQDKKIEIQHSIAGAQYTAQRLSYLDDVGFLHSTFEQSPYIRLPLAGKSLYRVLSPFRIGAHKDYTKRKTRRKVKRTIGKFGKKYSNSFISPDLKQTIKERNGQIVAISDLPVEWIEIDGIPLSFTHDVCRLPETTMQGLMAIYATNNHVNFSISKDILNKTLVIFGCSEDKFQEWQAKAKKLSSRLGFSTAECNSLEEVKTAINQFKPEFLIFDCHGGYDENTKSTFLRIGDEKLDAEYIIKHNLTAPLIFISACGTAPTYGTFNTIANPFFERGALSVTTTYLPIAIDSGSVLYLRLLNKLKSASEESIHKNWLEFVCHIIRTSAINESYLEASKDSDEQNQLEIDSSNVKTLTDVLFFNKRREVFHEMDQRINELTNKQKKYFSSVIPEYLFYSNLGRGDLIQFESWQKEFEKRNQKVPVEFMREDF